MQSESICVLCNGLILMGNVNIYIFFHIVGKLLLLLYNRIIHIIVYGLYYIFRLENDFYLGPPTQLRAHDIIIIFSSPVIRALLHTSTYKNITSTSNRFFPLLSNFFIYIDFIIPYWMSSLIKFGIAINYYLAISCIMSVIFIPSQSYSGTRLLVDNFIPLLYYSPNSFQCS